MYSFVISFRTFVFQSNGAFTVTYLVWHHIAFYGVLVYLTRGTFGFFGFLRGGVDSQHELCARITTEWLIVAGVGLV